jgi:hypothetical protein
MRANVIITALLFVLIAEPGRVSAQGVGGLVKKAGQAAKNANDKKDKAQEKSAAKPAEEPATRCDVSDDAYDRLLKGMQAEVDGLKAMGAEYATAKDGSNKYQQCTSQYAGTEEYQKILNKLPPSQNMTAEQTIKWMQDKTTGADSAMAKKCGKDPIRSWANSDRDRMIEQISQNAAKTAGMDDQCYANLKEFAAFYCSLPEATQQKATQEGLKVPGTGKDIYWVITPEHARALKPRCAKLMNAIQSVDRAVPK